MAVGKSPNDRMLGVRVTDDIFAAVEQAAADDDRTISNIVRIALVKWLRETKYLPANDHHNPAR